MFTFVPFEFPVSRDGRYTKVLADNVILKTRRNQLGLSQQEVADRVGVSLGLYQRLEYEASNLAGCSMRVGLAVCAVLMLDPYEMLPINITQQEPSAIKPLGPFDPDIPVTLRDALQPRKAGRKQIRREIMTIYVNHRDYGLIIPCNVLEAIGMPKYIGFLHSEEKKRIIIRGLPSRIENAFTVPDITYEGHPLVLPGGHQLTDKAKKDFGWDNDLYAVECFLARDPDKNIIIFADLHTAQPSEPLSGPFTIPMEFDDDDFGEDADD